MPDTLEATPTPASAETPSTPIQGNPTQNADRAALYEKHYGSQPAPEETPVVDPAAQAPATPTAPPVAQLAPEVLQMLSTMQAKLDALEGKIPAPPPPPAPDPNAEPNWITLLREGKIKEADEAHAAAIAAKIQQQITDNAVAQAREFARVEQITSAHVAAVRAANADLAPMQSYIEFHAGQLMQQAQREGKVKTTDDAIRVYTQSVDEAVANARKLYHTLRGDGKSEAMTRNREVISSLPVTPQGVQMDRTQASPDTPAPEPTVQDYLARRLAVSNANKGLASN